MPRGRDRALDGSRGGTIDFPRGRYYGFDADRDAIQTLAEVLRGREDLELVVLFGSFAKGNARADSDVDIAVVPAHELAPSEEAALEDAPSTAMGREIELLRLDRTDDVILRREVAQGLPLRERTPGVFARFRAEAMLEWLELEPLYLDAQRRFLRRVAGRGA